MVKNEKSVKEIIWRAFAISGQKTTDGDRQKHNRKNSQ